MLFQRKCIAQYCLQYVGRFGQSFLIVCDVSVVLVKEDISRVSYMIYNQLGQIFY